MNEDRNIDKVSQPTWFTVRLSNKKEYIEALQDNTYLEDDDNRRPLLFDVKDQWMKHTEFSFDSENIGMSYQAEYTKLNGTANIQFFMPLSDAVLIDIMKYAIKKFNKLKTVMETMK